MATFESSLLETLRGKIGNFIIYKVKQQYRIRTAPTEYRDANTPEQQANRNRLTACVRFYQRLRETPLRDAWRTAADKAAASSGYSLYLKTNMGVFLPDGTISDFSRLTLCPASGLKTADNMIATRNTDGTVTLTWENHAGKQSPRNTDRLAVAYLNENRSFTIRFVNPLPVCRDDERATFTTENTPGIATHLYCYFISREGDAYTPDTYIKLND